MNLLRIPFLAAVAALLLPSLSRANDIEPSKEFYTAKKAVNPIEIDGDLGEWTGANVLADPRFSIPKGSGDGGTLVNFEPYQGGSWTGPDDHTSNVRVLYDDDNVYFGFVVTDEYHENSANSAWNGDSVQLMVANATRDGQIALYNYALGGIETALGGQILMHEAGPGGTSAVVTRNTVTKRTTYEIKLPKESMALETLEAGVQFGLGMAINDGDELTPGQKGWGGLGAHSIVFGKTPSETALVTLAAPPPPRVQGNDIEPGKEFYTAVQAANPIVLDGELTEWRGAMVLADPRFSIPKGSAAAGTLVNFEPYQGGTWTGPDDQTSNVRVVYDDENVYFGFVVTDDYHENAANSAWNGDSVQLMIANATRDGQVALYNYALGGTENALGGIIVMHEAGPGGTSAVVKRNIDTNRTTYEIMLPKSALGLDTLAGGVQFGLGMAINDGDELTPGQKGWGGLGAHSIVFGKTPSETALVTLATANDIEPGKEFYFASPAPGPITLDGMLNDWSGVAVLSDPRFALPKGTGSRAPGATLTLFEVYQGGSWSGPDDHTSAVQIAYDANNVYFGFVVTDEYHENAANSAWNGDSVQLMVANGSQDAQVALYNYALGGVENALGSVIVQHEAGPGGTNAVVARDTAAKRTTYEIMLPRASMGLDELKMGTMFGLGMAINDGDQATPGQKGWGGLGAHSIVFGKTPSQTALVTLGIGGAGSPCFLSAIRPPTTSSPNTFTFRGNDFEGCTVDPAATRLLIDGAPAALVASPKVQGATDFTHTLAAPFEPGTEHVFTIELRDTTGSMTVERSIFTAPLIFASNLVGGGTFNTLQVYTRGNPELGDIDTTEAALDAANTYPPEDQIVAKTTYIHFDDNVGPPIYVAESRPYPLFDPVNGGTGRGDRDNFAIRSSGQISVIKPGKHWFVCNSDDGFSLRIDGTEIGSAGDRGRTNTAMSVDLTAGPHDVELVHWEHGGGAGVSLYVLKGVSEVEIAFGEDSHELVQAWLNPADTDADGMLDTYEAENGLNPAVNDAAQDKDGDGLTNLVESQKGTRADKVDTDADGLSDAVETNTGSYGGTTNTGTNPLVRDTDADGLADGAENNSSIFVSAGNAGTNPFARDTDGDGMSDGAEVRLGSSPVSAASLASVIEGGGQWDTKHVYTRSTVVIDNVDTALAALDDPSQFPAEDSIDLKTQYVHWHDNVAPPWFVSLSKPYPLFDPANGGSGFGDREDFATRSSGQIKITRAGMIWFNVNSDDGFSLMVDGVEIGAAGNRGRGNSVVSAELTAGMHQVEIVHWERGGGAGVSLLIYRAPSAEQPVSVDAETWQLLETFGTPASQLNITSFSYDPTTSLLNLTFTSEAGSNYALEYTTGFQPAGAPTSASKWNTVPGYTSIPGAAGTTSITPLNTTSLLAPAGQLLNNSISYFRIREL
ncbi:MAG: sugar-binding protein [Verrucomicrobiales bacterium]